MKQQYIIYVDGKTKKILKTYQDALRYVKKKYEDMIVRMDWEPRGSGGVDLWDNGISTIMIEKTYPEGVNPGYLAEQHTKIEKQEREKDSESINIDQDQKNKMPYTPRRTTLKMKRKKKASVMNAGDIKEGEDGNTYICKEKSNGTLYWTRYTQKTYQGVPVKKSTRKCPLKPAKEYKPGTTKKGEDGNLWTVKKMNNDSYRWVRKPD